MTMYEIPWGNSLEQSMYASINEGREGKTGPVQVESTSGRGESKWGL
jgi:hypothetical protein